MKQRLIGPKIFFHITIFLTSHIIIEKRLLERRILTPRSWCESYSQLLNFTISRRLRRTSEENIRREMKVKVEFEFTFEQVDGLPESIIESPTDRIVIGWKRGSSSSKKNVRER